MKPLAYEANQTDKRSCKFVERLLYYLTINIHFGSKDNVCQGEKRIESGSFYRRKKRQNGDAISETFEKSP